MNRRSSQQAAFEEAPRRRGQSPAASAGIRSSIAPIGLAA